MKIDPVSSICGMFVEGEMAAVAREMKTYLSSHSSFDERFQYWRGTFENSYRNKLEGDPRKETFLDYMALAVVNVELNPSF